jgi:hypothetical protein
MMSIWNFNQAPGYGLPASVDYLALLLPVALCLPPNIKYYNICQLTTAYYPLPVMLLMKNDSEITLN